MNKVRLQVIAPERVVFDGECTMLEYNTTEGFVGVLPGHVAMTQVIAPGKLTIYEEGKEKPMYAALISGIATIMPDTVTLLAEIIELPKEIDVERAKNAKDRAEKRIAERVEGLNLARAEQAIKRADVRLEVARSVVRSICSVASRTCQTSPTTSVSTGIISPPHAFSINAYGRC